MKKKYLAAYLTFFVALSAWADNGRLTINTDPSGATVYFSMRSVENFELLGKTPINYTEMAEGIYTLKIIRPDFDTVMLEDITVFPGKHKKILKKLVYSYSYLEIKSDPESSVVFIDEIKTGSTPYTNTLVIPAAYTITISPKDSLFKPYKQKIFLDKSDSLFIKKQHMFRSKSFKSEHLGLPPWRAQIEFGFQRLSHSGRYSRASGGDPSLKQGGSNTIKLDPGDLNFDSESFSSDSVKSSLFMPVVLRLGLPNDIEFHLHLPFRQYSPDANSTGDFGPSDMAGGVKYTLRKYKVALDATYKVDNATTSLKKTDSTGQFIDYERREYDVGTGYKSLALSIIGMRLIKVFQVYGNVGYQFRFSNQNNRDLNMGDNIFGYLQVGYLMHPWTPYLAVHGDYSFADKSNGNDSWENDGHLLAPEVGITVDASESFGLQAGIPFTVLGKNSLKYWGVHLSLSYNFGT